MVDINQLLRRGGIGVDVNTLIRQTAFESGFEAQEDKEGMYTFTAKCPSVFVDAAIACKKTIEDGTCFDTKYKEVFEFVEKVWTKCDNVLTLKQVVSLTDRLSPKILAMLKNKIVTKDKYSEDDSFDEDSCVDIIWDMFVPFLNLRKGDYIKNCLYYPIFDKPIDKYFLTVLKGYIVFNEKYKDFTFSEVQDFEDMYSSMKRLIEELPTGDK